MSYAWGNTVYRSNYLLKIMTLVKFNYVIQPKVASEDRQHIPSHKTAAEKGVDQAVWVNHETI